MDSRQLTPEQIEQLKEIVDRQLRFYGRLDVRMAAMGLPRIDPVFAAARKAMDAIRTLHTTLHNTQE